MYSHAFFAVAYCGSADMSDVQVGEFQFIFEKHFRAGMCKQFTNMARGKPWAKPKSSYNPTPLC